ncbi:MAG: transposase [Desulfobulbaceae bacterium]
MSLYHEFQRGLSLNTFLSTYGTEQECRETLFRLRLPNELVCPACGYSDFSTITTQRFFLHYGNLSRV